MTLEIRRRYIDLTKINSFLQSGIKLPYNVDIVCTAGLSTSFVALTLKENPCHKHQIVDFIKIQIRQLFHACPEVPVCYSTIWLSCASRQFGTIDVIFVKILKLIKRIDKRTTKISINGLFPSGGSCIIQLLQHFSYNELYSLSYLIQWERFIIIIIIIILLMSVLLFL